MMITGPEIKKTVHVPAHDIKVLDEDAYWNLDFDGTELPPGADLTLLYAKVAFPTLTAAQHQYAIERLALEQRRRPVKRHRPVRGGLRREQPPG